MVEFEDKTTYEGEWENNLRHGYGVFKNAEGKVNISFINGRLFIKENGKRTSSMAKEFYSMKMQHC